MNFNPIITTNASGSFSTATDGYIVGTYLADPAVRFQLAGGILAAAEVLPMVGGVGISEAVEAASLSPQLGGSISRAINLTAAVSGQQAVGKLTGFSVFDQAHDWINSPQSPVPSGAPGMGVKFFRLGSLARIVVGIDPVLANLRSHLVESLVSWDFSLQRLVPYVAAYPANVFTVLTRALVSGSYVATATTTSAHGVAVGDDFTVSGCVPAAYNGTWTAIAGTTGSTLVWSLNTAIDPGAESTLGTLVAGGGALPCKVLDVDVGNSMAPVIDPVTNFVTWNRSSSAAVIQI